MHKRELTCLSLVVACALPLAAGAQQGLRLKSQPALILIPPSVREDVPLFIQADRVQGRQDGDIEAEGGVRLRRRRAQAPDGGQPWESISVSTCR